MKTDQQHIDLSTPDEEEKRIWKILEEVMDPEVPVLSVIDLGIVRKISPLPAIDNGWNIEITPTYSGCPAMDTIRTDIRLKLIEHGYKNVKITQVLSPAWTTDWMSENGKEKLKAFGIAPPNPRQQVCTPHMFQESEAVQCPRCNSYSTTLISQFGSTACKALYRCSSCLETFDYFKCH
jgi:ring-1,2-phenylacetyl-CoA epoxidase subunit PaaD